MTIIKDHIRDLWEQGKAALEANYAERRRPTDPETFDGYIALTNAAAAEIGASNFLMETIANDRVGPTIFKMHWTRHPLKHSKFHLLTSDRPIIMPVGLADQRAYIALPASPTVLFVAAHDPTFARSLADWKHTELVKVLNKAVVCQARKFVWGTDASQLEFIRRHIGTAPDRTIITEAQKQEALAVARGESQQQAAHPSASSIPGAEVETVEKPVGETAPMSYGRLLTPTEVERGGHGRRSSQSLSAKLLSRPF